jgi:putative membrane protein
MAACTVYRLIVVAAATTIAATAEAHVGTFRTGAGWPETFTGAPGSGGARTWILVALALSAALYAVGVIRLWRISRTGGGIRIREVIAFGCGCGALGVALIGPLDLWAERSFAAHMLQHEALMLAAAPLLVAGRPLAAWTWAMSRRWRRFVRSMIGAPAVRRAWRCLMRPQNATILQLVLLAVWHIPALFGYSAVHRGVHALQHASFLVSALCFWWSLRAPVQAGSLAAGARAGLGMVCLFVTMMGSGALGGLLTFAPSPWYGAHGGYPLPWASSALEDQQLGGLLMWVPGGTVYLVAALRLAWRLLVRAAPALPVDRRTETVSPAIAGTAR